MDDLTDAELHALIIARDEPAFAEWERRIARDALGAARKRGLSLEDAEEIWNEALLVVWRRAIAEPPIEPLGEGLRRYTFGVVARLAANFLRRRGREVDTYPLDDRDQAANQALWLPMQRPSKRVHALRRCMEMIDERWRLVLELSAVGIDPEEMANTLHISPGSVRKYIQRARAVIRECLEDELNV